jgi:hypothetical protein
MLVKLEESVVFELLLRPYDSVTDGVSAALAPISLPMPCARLNAVPDEPALDRLRTVSSGVPVTATEMPLECAS